MYNYLFDPLTKQYVNINSKRAKNIIQNYLIFLGKLKIRGGSNLNEQNNNPGNQTTNTSNQTNNPGSQPANQHTDPGSQLPYRGNQLPYPGNQLPYQPPDQQSNQPAINPFGPPRFTNPFKNIHKIFRRK